MIKENNAAVSPVVGVMLMLVVTILIAAVVSAFAGGMGGSTKEKAPQVTLRGEYSLSNGITIEHTGGDTVATRDAKLLIRGSPDIGTDYLITTVNKSSISDANGKVWMKPTGSAQLTSFGAGDIIYIKPPYHTCGFIQPPRTTATSCWDQASNIGKHLIVEFSDNSGNRIFAKTQIAIVP